MPNANHRLAAAKLLFAHLITVPNLAEQLLHVHNLAIYDSGAALLGPEEKECLLNTKELAERIRPMKPDDWKYIESLLPA